MSPGARIDREVSNILRVSGQLVMMIVKKKVWRSTVESAADQLERSAGVLREILRDK